MEFSEVIKKRHSIRAFQDKEIEADKLEKILEAPVDLIVHFL